MVNDFSEVLNNLNQDKIDWNSDSKIIGNKFITFENYTKYYIKLHIKNYQSFLMKNTKI